MHPPRCTRKARFACGSLLLLFSQDWSGACVHVLGTHVSCKGEFFRVFHLDGQFFHVREGGAARCSAAQITHQGWCWDHDQEIFLLGACWNYIGSPSLDHAHLSHGNFCYCWFASTSSCKLIIIHRVCCFDSCGCYWIINQWHFICSLLETVLGDSYSTFKYLLLLVVP